MDPSDEFVLIDNINGTVYTMEQTPKKGIQSVEIELYRIPYGEKQKSTAKSSVLLIMQNFIEIVGCSYG